MSLTLSTQRLLNVSSQIVTNRRLKKLCIYTHILHSIENLIGRQQLKKTGQQGKPRAILGTRTTGLLVLDYIYQNSTGRMKESNNKSQDRVKTDIFGVETTCINSCAETDTWQ